MGTMIQDKYENESHIQLAHEDVVRGLMEMGILARLRYVLEVVRIPPAVDVILDILVVFSCHSVKATSDIIAVSAFRIKLSLIFNSVPV